MSHDAYDASVHFKRYARTSDKEISVTSVTDVVFEKTVTAFRPTISCPIV